MVPPPGIRKSPAFGAGLFALSGLYSRRSALPTTPVNKGLFPTSKGFSLPRSCGNGRDSNYGDCLVALDVAVESRPFVGYALNIAIRGGLREFRAFDGRLGIAVVLHAGEERGVVFVATGLLDRVGPFIEVPGSGDSRNPRPFALKVAHKWRTTFFFRQL